MGIGSGTVTDSPAPRPTGSGADEPAADPTTEPDPARRLALRRLRELPPGTRLTVRYALPTADSPSGPRLTDAIGELQPAAAQDPEAVVLQTRKGPVRIALADVRLARPVPPPPPRRLRS